MNLSDKTIVITGGARGIGREMALAYKKSGANVAICSRTQADLDAAMRELREISSG
ncbi:MAG: SDR family NAD(P)-dependent oxidoreductase [Bdellovibrionales bacterium]|nr:SDR family NAD(P)-dependent oxidoreductase [Bdellovibrionales bacterium]